MIISKQRAIYFFYFSSMFFLTGSFQLLFVSLGAASDRSGGNISFQIALLLSFIISCYQFNKHSSNKRFLNDAARIAPLLALTFFCLLSSFWSVEPMVSLRRGIALVLITAILYFMSIALSSKQILKIFLQTSFGCACLAFVFSFFPGLGIDTENTMYDAAWRGLTGHKTDLGKIVSIGIVILFTLLILKEIRIKFFLLLLPIMSFALYKSQSTTSIALAILSVILLPLFNFIFTSKISPLMKFSKFWIIILLTYAVGYAGFYVAVEFLGKDETLTGRTVIWEYALTLFNSEPMFGFGYRSFWIDANTADFHYFNPYWGEILMNNGHNGFIDVLLELGLVGFLFYAVLIINFVWILAKADIEKSDSKVLVLSGFICLYFYLIYSITEQVTLDQSDYFWSLLTILYLNGANRK